MKNSSQREVVKQNISLLIKGNLRIDESFREDCDYPSKTSKITQFDNKQHLINNKSNDSRNELNERRTFDEVNEKMEMNQLIEQLKERTNCLMKCLSSDPLFTKNDNENNEEHHHHHHYGNMSRIQRINRILRGILCYLKRSKMLRFVCIIIIMEYLCRLSYFTLKLQNHLIRDLFMLCFMLTCLIVILL